MNSQPLPINKERSRLHDSVNITTEPNNIIVKIGNMLNYFIVKRMSDIYNLFYRWTGTHNT